MITSSLIRTAVALIPLMIAAVSAAAEDWTRFRGSDGHARAETAVPTAWNVEPGQEKNLAWKTLLDGRGASSPVVFGDRIYLTEFTGYAIDTDAPGDRDALTLHVLCFSAADGSRLWNYAFPASPDEQTADRRVADHGFATPTPACDEHGVVAYFGVSGLIACTPDGDVMWKAQTGTKTVGFGCAASPVIHNDLVIMNASIESSTVFAFNRMTGEEVWRIEDVNRSWTTPLVAVADSGRAELIISSKDVVRGFDPQSGGLLWTCSGVLDYVVPCVVSERGIVWVLGGRRNQSMAVRLGGSGDVTETHRIWHTNIGANVTSPVLNGNRLYWISDRGIANCLDADTGQEIYRSRAATQERVYASTILVGNHMYLTTRENGILVIDLTDEYHVVQHNPMPESDGLINATPTPNGSQLLIRTDRNLYCIAAQN